MASSRLEQIARLLVRKPYSVEDGRAIQTILDFLATPLAGVLLVGDGRDRSVDFSSSGMNGSITHHSNGSANGYTNGEDPAHGLARHLFRTCDGDAARGDVAQARLDELGIYSEVLHVPHCGAECRWWNVSYSVLTRDAEGAVRHFLAHAVDVTETWDMGNIGDFAQHVLESRSGGKITITRRELEVLRLVATGMTDREVAEQLFISVQTAATHRRNMVRKMGVPNSAALVKLAVSQGLIRVET